MKNCLLLLSFLLIAVSASADNKYYLRKAQKYMKKLGLEKHEMYYMEKQDVIAKIDDSDGSIQFPMNYVYNEQGLKVKAKYKSGDTSDIMNSFGVFADDYSAFVNDTGSLEYITVQETLQQDARLIKPVFDSNHQASQKETVVIYYPAGLPFTKKSYKELIDRIKYHREEGKGMNVCFVMVRVWEHVEGD